MTDQQQKDGLEIMRHTLGLNYKPLPYRNHFVTGKGCSDFDIIVLLESEGLMARSRKPDFLDESDMVFHVTEKGKEFVLLHQPAPEKLSRSQKRYRAYLSADSTESFGEWIKNHYWDSYRAKYGC